MNDSASRRDELIGAALGGDLSDDEQREFDRAAAIDPTMLRDLLELQGTAARLHAIRPTWQDSEPPALLSERIIAATSGTEEPPAGTAVRADGIARGQGADPAARRPRSVLARHRRGVRASMTGAAAAGLLMVGALGGLLVEHRLQAPPEGPAGTLGAIEEVAVEGGPAGAEIEVSLVAHTWGTETMLEVDGLAVGESYEVLLVSRDGDELPSGTFIGTEQTVTCQMNAAILREQVSEVLIRDGAGDAVVTMDVPAV